MNKNYLQIEIERTPEQLALAKQLGSKNRTESLEAAEAIAQAINRPLLQVIMQAPTLSNFFQVWGVGENEAAKIPLDLFFDVRQRNFLHITQQAAAGGTATNYVVGNSERYVDTYKLAGAASMDKSFARASNLQVIAKTLERLAQEVLIKQNINATNVVMASLANSFIDGNANNTAVTNLQVVRSATQDRFQLDDFNTMMTKYRRIVSSWVGGTPVGIQASLTDLIGSPEWMGQLRSIAYQPQNTVAGSIGGTETSNTSIAAPESVREEIFRAAGIPSLFGVNLVEFNEFGVGQSYNSIFGNYAGATQYAGYGGGAAAAFTPASEEIVLGLNQSMFDLVRVRREQDGSEWTLAADDTFTVRSDKVGFYGDITEGYVSLDNRAKLAVIW